jgi:hypothetical protein
MSLRPFWGSFFPRFTSNSPTTPNRNTREKCSLKIMQKHIFVSCCLLTLKFHEKSGIHTLGPLRNAWGWKELDFFLFLRCWVTFKKQKQRRNMTAVKTRTFFRKYYSITPEKYSKMRIKVAIELTMFERQKKTKTRFPPALIIWSSSSKPDNQVNLDHIF